MTLFLSVTLLVAVTALVAISPRAIRRHQPRPQRPEEGTRSISVVVAARNEAPRIGAMIRSLRAQDHPDLELIVVDDRSDDGTGAAAREAAEDDPRVTVLSTVERPRGWSGRMYALDVGARAASKDGLLFLSADHRATSTALLRSLVAEYERVDDVAAMSVVGPFRGDAWWSRWWFRPLLNNPVFWRALFTLQDLIPTSRWLIGALAMRRRRFCRIGGVAAAVKSGTGVFDDWGWARLFERQGGSTRMLYHPGLEDVSNWTDFRTFWHAFNRWQVGLFTYRRGGWAAALLLGGAVAAAVAGVIGSTTSALAGEQPTLTVLLLAAIGPITGAGSRRLGRFEVAAHGTIFLDEVGDLDLARQAKLLRVLQDLQFERVGGNTTLRMTARVIAATNRDLHAAVMSGDFRADLYFRLNVVRLHMPALRARPEDVPVIARSALRGIAERNGFAEPLPTDEFLDRLTRQRWPGNVRELLNALEHVLVRQGGGVLKAAHLDGMLEELPLESARDTSLVSPLLEERLDKERIANALWRTGGNVSRAARRLGMSRERVRYRIRKYRLSELIPRD